MSTMAAAPAMVTRELADDSGAVSMTVARLVRKVADALVEAGHVVNWPTLKVSIAAASHDLPAIGVFAGDLSISVTLSAVGL